MYRWLTVQTIFTFICFQYETGQTGKHRPKDVSKKKQTKTKTDIQSVYQKKNFLILFFFFVFVCVFNCLFAFVLFCSVNAPNP